MNSKKSVGTPDMKKTTIFMSILIIKLSLPCPSVFSLESLTPDQMKNTVARAGVDIAITDAVVENYLHNVRFENTSIAGQYLSFDGIHFVSTLNTGSSDMNGDGLLNHLSLDVSDYNNQVMLFFDCPDLNLTTDITVNSIDFYGTPIGSLSTDNMVLSSFHLYMGPHVNTGIDFELGVRMKIFSQTYKYNSTDSLTFSKITFAESISGTPDDPSTWNLTTGQFRIGDLEHNNPATIDFFADPTTDTSNPRYDAGYVALNLPMNGSIRVENVTFGSNNFGSIAIDGLQVEKLYIEIPGRGLGKK